MRTRLTTTLLAVIALTVFAAAPAAHAAGKPTITRVSPMRLHVGDRVSVYGRNFSARRRSNTLVFRGNGRSAFLKPRRATRRKLVFVVSSAVGRIATRTTRFRLRVLVRRTFGAWTPRRLSPVVVGTAVTPTPPTGGTGGGTGGSTPPTKTPPPPADCDHDGTPDSTDTDDDNDLLTDTFEASIGTDRCDADTDGDGVEDGYEEQSAIDLNHYPGSPPQPYPAKRPYPNALDPSDGAVDYDGDGLTLHDEYLAWVRFSADGVARSGRPTTLANLLYSDGLQQSISPPPAAPVAPLDKWSLDWDGNGTLSDDERDADGDKLGNWDEQHGKMTEAWWPKEHGGNPEPKESPYPDINFLDNADLPQHDALANADVDGDGIADGADDYDHDGLTNEFEVRRPANWDDPGVAFVDPTTKNFAPGADPWAYTNPFNPCKPFNSERCHRYAPFGYYDNDEAPPIGPDPPAGYPDTHPATPAG